jgi:hypothetical protein
MQEAMCTRLDPGPARRLEIAGLKFSSRPRGFESVEELSSIAVVKKVNDGFG